MRASITGIGWVTATNMGCGRDNNRFEFKGGKLPEITRKDVFDAPWPHFGRLDAYSRLGLSAIGFALKDAEMDRWSHPRPVGIIASTWQGCLDTDLDYYKTVATADDRPTSPNRFAYTLPNSYLGEAAIRFGLTGVSYIVSEPTESELWCLRLALTGMAGGQFDTVLCGRCELGRGLSVADNLCRAAGALFFTLEKNPAEANSVYGRLEMNSDGGLRADGIDVEDLATLTRRLIGAGLA